MSYFILAFLIGFIAGLRSLTAPAVVSWAARLGWIHLENSPLAFFGAAVTPWIFTVLAIAELVSDQLPRTPSRKAPPGFIARILMGGLSGPHSAWREDRLPLAQSREWQARSPVPSAATKREDAWP